MDYPVLFCYNRAGCNSVIVGEDVWVSLNG